MNLATLRHDESAKTWSAEYDGKVLVKSVGGQSSKDYVINRILQGQCAKAVRLNVTGFSNLNVSEFAPAPNGALGKPFVQKVKPNNQLSVTERFELLDECIDIAIKTPNIRSLIITGQGSIGKTFHTREKIKEHGLLSTEEAFTRGHTLTPEEQVVADGILASMEKFRDMAHAYYEEHGLPKKKSKKDDESDDVEDNAPEDDDEDDGISDEELKIVWSLVDFTCLHTSRELSDRQAGGRFIHGVNRYDFNIKLAVKNPQEYYDVIVPHEMAHHIDGLLNPGKTNKLEGHSRSWRNIMRKVFKIEPSRYHSMETTSVLDAPDLEGDYHYMKGYTSAKGLYRTLFENKKKIVVFDDADAAWKNDVSALLLKAALDTDVERWVSWNVEGSANDDLPRRFLFEGKVIFISNVKSEDFPQALITRALRCDIELTMEERFERMRQILTADKFGPGIPQETKQMAYDFLWENRDVAKEISTRALLNICNVAASGSKLWKRIALSNIQ